MLNPPHSEHCPDTMPIEDPDLREIFTVAQTIENPLDKGLILSSVVKHLHDEPGFDLVKHTAYQAYLESCQPPWSTGCYEFKSDTVLRSIALAALDPAMASRLDPGYNRDTALAEIAYATGDTSIIPTNEFWGRDHYYVKKAKENYDPDVIRQIEDVESRVEVTMRAVYHLRKSGENHRADELFAESWELIGHEPDTEIRDQLYVRYVDTVATAKELHNPLTRLKAFRALLPDGKTATPEAIQAYCADIKPVLRQTIMSITDSNDKETAETVIASIFCATKDHEIGEYVSDQNVHTNVAYNETLRLLRETKNISLLSIAPWTHSQGTHMAEIVQKVGSVEVARSIEHPWWRNRALAYVTAKLPDSDERLALLQQEVIENTLADHSQRGARYVAGDVVTSVRAMDDKRVGWRLLDDERIYCGTIADIAEHFLDADLALQIADNHPALPELSYDTNTDGRYARDRALHHIATRTDNYEIARRIHHPILKGRALLQLYHQRRSQDEA